MRNLLLLIAIAILIKFLFGCGGEPTIIVEPPGVVVNVPPQEPPIVNVTVEVVS